MASAALVLHTVYYLWLFEKSLHFLFLLVKTCLPDLESAKSACPQVLHSCLLGVLLRAIKSALHGKWESQFKRPVSRTGQDQMENLVIFFFFLFHLQEAVVKLVEEPLKPGILV